ncbi:phage tail tape measure protein [Deinococcus sp. HMF7620]|uniref:Phage tail tape measure protein n=1 Tax=Deinococcus arboris TaxID=2682977 RepID=A0A7C9HT41_9DEIO|nr:phage tail tape measure protein [Deinococcus arboris]MVN88294.1 phage tail tape measure protein [Deinococcus arboris]
MSTRVGAAHLDLTIVTASARAAVTAFASAARADLAGLARPIKLTVKADPAALRTQVDNVKTAFRDLNTDLKNLLKVDVTALKGVISKIGKQIVDLTELERKLRASTPLGGGGGGGAGGGSPGVNGAYAAQLRGLQADLKNSVLNTAQFEQATRQLKTTIDTEIASLKSLGVLSREQQARLDALRGASSQAAGALKGLADQQRRAAEAAASASATQFAAQLRGYQADLKNGALNTASFEAATRALKTSIDAEIASLRALGPLTQAQQAHLDALRATSGQAATALKGLADAQARAAREAARGAERAQSDSVKKLAQDVENLKGAFDRGDIKLRAYLRGLQGVQREAQTLAPTLAAGSSQAASLNRVLDSLTSGRRKLNDRSITQIKTDLAAARAEFERATAAAGRFSEKRAAIQALETTMRGLEARVKAVGERSNVTAGQMGQLNRLSTQLRSNVNTLNLAPSGLGISGSILAALKQLPQFASMAGGSLGAAAAQASALGGSFSGVGAAAGPLGLALAAVAAAVVGLTAALTVSIQTAAQFEQKLADIRALTQPTAIELERLTQATFDIGKPLGVGAREAAGAVLELNRAGLSAADAIGGGLKGALELAGAAGITAAEGGKLATAAMTAFGLQAPQLSQVADVFANFSNKTFLGAEDLSLAIAAVGPVARDAGLGLEQFAGYMATLAQGGFKQMSDAGTSLKTMLLSLTSPVDTGAKALDAIKVSAFDSAGQMRPLNDVLGDLRGKLVELTPQAQKQLLRQIFGQDAIRAAQILLREGPKAIEANTEAMRKQGEAARVARERLESLQGAGKQFGATFEQLKIQIGTPFLAALTGIVRGATAATEGLIGLIDQAREGQGALGTFATTSQQVLAAFGQGAATVFAALRVAWDTVLWPVLRALGAVWLTIQQAAVTALGILLNVANAVFQGVAAAVRTVMGVFGVGATDIAGSTGSMADAVVRGAGIARVALVALGQFTAQLPDIFELAGQGIGTMLRGLGQLFQAFGQRAGAVFTAAGGYVGAYVKATGRAVQSAGQILQGLAGMYAALLLAARNALVTGVGQILATGIRHYGQFSDGVQTVLAQVAGVFFRYVVQPVQDGANFLLQAYNRVSGIISSAANRIARTLGPIGDLLKSLGVNIGAGLARVAQTVGDGAADIIDNYAQRANEAYAKAQASAQQASTTNAKSAADGVAAALTGASQGLTDFIRDNGAGEAFEKATGQVTSGLQGVSAVSGQLQQDVKGVATTLNTQLSTATQTATAGLGELRTGAALTAGALQLAQRANEDAAASFTAGLKNMQQSAKTTATAVAAIKPPTVMASGTKTLDDIGLGDKEKASSTKTTAADLVKQAEYKKNLKDLTPLELAQAKAEAQRTNNKKAMTAILAEEARRERERASAARSGAAADRQATEARAGLVREMRQSIAAFKLQSDQGKVTAQSLLAFNQRMEDFQARVKKLPPALQAGTQALFNQAAALAANAKVQARAVVLTGAALTEYKEALRGKSAQQLKDMEVDARAGKLSTQLNAILAERTRRTEAKAAADKKAAAAAEQHAKAQQTLVRETGQLNDRFRLQVQQGKVTAESLQRYQQALADTKAKVEQLPPTLRGSVTALITQGQTLATQGQAVVNHRQEVEKLRGEVDRWTLAQLENARARVIANGADKDKLALLDSEIAKRKTLSDAQVQEALTESRLNEARADQEGIEGQYENRKAAAQGNLTELLRLELDFGAQVQAARDAAARAAATDEERQVRDKYAKLLNLEGITQQRRTELEQARDRELEASRTRLSNALAKNDQDRRTAETDARQQLNDSLETLDRESAERIRAATLKDLEARTRDVEAQLERELDVEDLSEQEKLALRKAFQPRLLAAKQAELDQTRVIEEAAEKDRYTAAVQEAEAQGLLDQQRLQADGRTLTVRQVLEEAHQVELGRIRRESVDAYRDYELEVKRETGKQVVASEKATTASLKEEAESRTETLLDGLDDFTAAQRQAARETLAAWRLTYLAQGASGAAAVAQIDAALAKLERATGKARSEAAKLGVRPADAQRDFGDRQARLGDQDDEAGARREAEGKFSSDLDFYEQKIKDLQAAINQFGDTPLTPDEAATRDGLLGLQQQYQGYFDQLTLASRQAGDKAAATYTQAQLDKAAEGELALVEARHTQAENEGRDDSPAYLAGLNAALAYWRARLLGLEQGTPEYLAALQKIVELEGKVSTEKGNPVADRLSNLAGVVGKGGKLQGTISAGLDGLAAYFKAGGTKGGKGSLIAGAQALVSGLAGVFKTGDEDIDQVVDTFVSGLQGTLGALAKGDWVGAIVAGVATLVTTLIDIFKGGANSAKKAAEQIGAATKDVRFFDLGKYAKVESRGGFWGFLGFKKATIDQEAVDIAKSLGDALYTAVSSALLDGIQQGKRSFSELGLDVRKGLGQQILQGLVDGFLKGAVMQGLLQPFLDGYIAAMKSGNAQALAQAANGLQNAIATGNAALAQFYETVLVPAAEQMGQFGSEGSQGQGTAATDLGLASAPTGVMAAPAYVLDQTAAMNKFTPALLAAVPVLQRLADEGLHVTSQSEINIIAPQSDLRAYAAR